MNFSLYFISESKRRKTDNSNVAKVSIENGL